MILSNIEIHGYHIIYLFYLKCFESRKMLSTDASSQVRLISVRFRLSYLSMFVIKYLGRRLPQSA